MTFTINGIQVEANPGDTILEAARFHGIRIPTLCFLREVNQNAACRICLVEVTGMQGLQPACAVKAADGMEVYTDTEAVRTARRRNLELICANHTMDCTNCSRGTNCELRELCKEYEVDDRAYGIGKREKKIDNSSAYLIRDNSKCILCRRCMSVCRNVQGIGAISVNFRAGQTNVGFGIKLSETNCVGCGQCVLACPTGALSERDDTRQVWKAVLDKRKYVIAVVSSDTSARLGELFGSQKEADSSGKIVSILHKIGFDKVFSADAFDQVYEAYINTEIQTRIQEGKVPAIDSRCPAWRHYIENFYPQMLTNLLTTVGKHEYVARHYRSQFSEENTYLVYIDNCISVKEDICKSGSSGSIDAALTTRELFSLIRRACVSNFTASEVWNTIEEEFFDQLSEEENLRDVNKASVSSSALENGFSDDRAYHWKSSSVEGLSQACDMLKHPEEYDYLKVMACPGSCKYGGGAPHEPGYQTK